MTLNESWSRLNFWYWHVPSFQGSWASLPCRIKLLMKVGGSSVVKWKSKRDERWRKSKLKKCTAWQAMSCSIPGPPTSFVLGTTNGVRKARLELHANNNVVVVVAAAGWCRSSTKWASCLTESLSVLLLNHPSVTSKTSVMEWGVILCGRISPAFLPHRIMKYSWSSWGVLAPKISKLGRDQTPTPGMTKA